MSNNAAWIIDGEYARINAKKKGFKIDYMIMKNHLQSDVLNGHSLQNSFFISSRNETPSAGFLRFTQFLSREEPIGPGMKVELLNYKTRTNVCGSCGVCERIYVQRGVDIAIAERIRLASESHKVLILFLGDSDFVETITRARVDGCSIVVAGFRGSIAAGVRNLADRIIWLDDDEKVWKLRKIA